MAGFFKWLKEFIVKAEREKIKNLIKQIKSLKRNLSEETILSRRRSKRITILTKHCQSLEKEILRIKKPVKRYKPKFTSIGQFQIRKLIKGHYDNVRYIWNDTKYKTVSINEFKKILKEDKTDSLKYFSETFDCENFAGLFKNRMALNYGINAIGKVMNYKGGHAFNLIVCSDGLFVLEPQNDLIWKASENGKKGIRFLIDNAIIDI